MLKTILVKELVDDGEKLLQELDRRQFPITAAFWYESPERQRWKIYIVSDAAHQLGPLEGYKRVQEAMGALGGLSFALDDVAVWSPRSSTFRELRRTIEGVSQTSVSGERVHLEGAALEDAYIYRWSYE
ncbi:MAG TPA: hypothetical protein VGV68_05515 [Terriglobia bacterium]|nr:hypothetical protein [Terriglobia bacterium]